MIVLIKITFYQGKKKNIYNLKSKKKYEKDILGLFFHAYISAYRMQGSLLHNRRGMRAEDRVLPREQHRPARNMFQQQLHMRLLGAR